MKPTTSQLAKQNQERLMDQSRFQKSGNSSLNVEGQEAKRQKLEGGLLCKEGGMDGRLHITVPRPPDLATAHGFKALPLNRKVHIKNIIYQKFHQKTTERAAQNTAVVPSTSSCCNNLKIIVASDAIELFY
ncbi:hypothetical protein L2E82_36512 [Cichorium intybus]|uniref:Uncharacterized protein n=1 Tax=Cichorium intybus TaxID=13427 RepID=A0ACB9BRW5_CICIN|nr:hypothetical protein L2E82_36512 [Cichorium intybus]